MTLIQMPEQRINDPRGNDTQVSSRCALCNEPEYVGGSFVRCWACGDLVCASCMTTEHVEAVEPYIDADTTVVVEDEREEPVCLRCAEPIRVVDTAHPLRDGEMERLMTDSIDRAKERRTA